MSQLFTDLSAAEQEVVAGGDGVVDFGQDSASKFKTFDLFANSEVGTYAGPGGSGSYSNNSLEKHALSTKSKNKFGVKFPG